jgi:succinoglycan biosynthesis protein ExoO
MMKPEVSIIIAAYNTRTYIAQSIESALNQTLKNIEVIVVDDGSTDKTSEVVNQFADSRLRLLVSQNNFGAANARNQALEIARGEWIAILDSDDWYASNRLERLLKIAYSENADMIADNLLFIRDGETQPWSTLIQESGEKLGVLKEISPICFAKAGRHGSRGIHIGLTKPLIRRDFLVQQSIQYNPAFKTAEDYWLYLVCLVRGAHFILVPEPYYFYRSRQGSLLDQNKLEHLHQCSNVIADLMRYEVIQKDINLTHTLGQNLSRLKQYEEYYRVAELLKQGHALEAITAAINNPYFFIYIIKSLPGILKRRTQYYILKDRTVFKTFVLK